MATQTTNYNLVKPDYTDPVDVSVLNDNSDIIDTTLAAKANLVGGKVPASELPSYVDDVIEGYYYNGAFYEDAGHTTLITGETGKIYIDLDSENCYRWTGSVYVVISFDPSNYYTKTQVDSALGNKVDKVAGKGLSTEDFTTTDKNNLDSNTAARHTHTNKAVLDKFGELGGNPTYDGNPIGGGGTTEVIELIVSYRLAYDRTEIAAMWPTSVLKLNGNIVVGAVNSYSPDVIKIFYIMESGGDFFLYYNEYNGTSKATISTLNKVGLWSEKDFTATYQSKLAGIEAGAQENVIETIYDAGGTPLTVTSKSVTLPAASGVPNGTADDDILVWDDSNSEWDIRAKGSISSSNTGWVTGGDVYTALTGKEDTANKVTSLSSSSTDTEYPSAKAVYDFVDTLVGNADTLLGSGVIS